MLAAQPQPQPGCHPLPPLAAAPAAVQQHTAALLVPGHHGASQPGLPQRRLAPGAPPASRRAGVGARSPARPPCCPAAAGRRCVRSQQRLYLQPQDAARQMQALRSNRLQVRPYAWSVWLAILLTVLAFPLLVYAAELLTLKVCCCCCCLRRPHLLLPLHPSLYPGGLPQRLRPRPGGASGGRHPEPAGAGRQRQQAQGGTPKPSARPHSGRAWLAGALAAAGADRRRARPPTHPPTHPPTRFACSRQEDGTLALLRDASSSRSPRGCAAPGRTPPSPSRSPSERLLRCGALSRWLMTAAELAAPCAAGMADGMPSQARRLWLHASMRQHCCALKPLPSLLSLPARPASTACGCAGQQPLGLRSC